MLTFRPPINSIYTLPLGYNFPSAKTFSEQLTKYLPYFKYKVDDLITDDKMNDQDVLFTLTKVRKFAFGKI